MSARRSTPLTKRLVGGLYTRFQHHVKKASNFPQENQQATAESNGGQETGCQGKSNETGEREGSDEEFGGFPKGGRQENGRYSCQEASGKKGATSKTTFETGDQRSCGEESEPTQVNGEEEGTCPKRRR